MGERASYGQNINNQLQVIGAGFGRTGTQSLHLALDRLGLRCFHTTHLARNPSLVALWHELATSSAPESFEFARIFAVHGYNATVDFPSCMYYKALMAAYPNAKVILSVRDSGTAWYHSAVKYSLAFHPSILGFGGVKIFYRANPVGRFIYEMLNRSYLHHFSDVGNQQQTIAQYESWIQEVKAYVPSDKLLTYNVKEGWAPLCKFLAVDVCPTELRPAVPFPRADVAGRYTDALVPFMGYATLVIYLLFAFLVFSSARRRSKRIAAPPTTKFD